MNNQPMSNQFDDKELEELAQVLAASVPYAPPPSPRFAAALRQRLMAAYDEPAGWRFSWLPSLVKTGVSFAAILLLLVAGWHYLDSALTPEPEPMAEPAVIAPATAPDPAVTAAPTATAVSALDEIPIVGGIDSVDSVGITAVLPSTDTLTQTTTFTVTIRYQLDSTDSAYLDVKLVEDMGGAARGLESRQLPISNGAGTLTTTLIFRPGDVAGPTTIRLRAELKTDPRAIPLNITMPHYRWQYLPPDNGTSID
jgi:hypothetical protein